MKERQVAPLSKLPPLRVVQTIHGPQTGGGPGDVHVATDGSRWLVIEPTHASGTTPGGVIRSVVDGWIK